MAIWHILLSFGIFSPHCGMLYQDKSGNPVLNSSSYLLTILIEPVPEVKCGKRSSKKDNKSFFSLSFHVWLIFYRGTACADDTWEQCCKISSWRIVHTQSYLSTNMSRSKILFWPTLLTQVSHNEQPVRGSGRFYSMRWAAHTMFETTPFIDAVHLGHAMLYFFFAPQKALCTCI
jgi:hypothetical protein